MIAPDYLVKRWCRCCEGEELQEYLNLGIMPLVNTLSEHLDDSVERFPLSLYYCRDCYNSQLSIVVDPKRLYAHHYPYRSGISQTFRRHADQLADYGVQRFGAAHVLDIGCNDGTLLQAFQRRGCDVLGIDPASFPENNLPMVRGFWGIETAQALGRTFDIITAQNVFAHCDDAMGFLRAAAMVLREGGILIIEFPYQLRLLEGVEWDTIYHEHLNYHLIAPFKRLVESQGFYIESLEEFPIHGGSVRALLRVGKQPSIAADVFIAREKACGLLGPEIYDAFTAAMAAKIALYRDIIASLPGRLIGYGASAKSVVFLNHLGLTLDCVVDDTPSKWGKFIPGTSIPIVPPQDAGTEDASIIILAWNFYAEILPKAKALSGIKAIVRFLPDIYVEQ